MDPLYMYILIGAALVIIGILFGQFMTNQQWLSSAKNDWGHYYHGMWHIISEEQYMDKFILPEAEKASRSFSKSKEV